MNNFYLLFCLFLSSIGFGQVSLFVGVDSKELRVNNPMKLTVVLEINGENYIQESPIKLPDLSHFEMVSDGSSQNCFFDLAKNTRINQVVYQMILLPKSSGKMRIGSVIVRVNGKIHKTEPFDINVLENKQEKKFYCRNEGVYCQLQVECKKVYPNEPLLVTLRGYSKSVDGLKSIHQVQFKNMKQVRIHQLSKQQSDIDVVDDEWVTSVIATYLVYPQMSGRVEIPEITAETGNHQKIKSNKVFIEVEDFGNRNKYKSNIVGNFTMEVEDTSSSKKIQINQPINVKLKLIGNGNFSDIKVPEIISKSDKYRVFKPKITKNIHWNEKGEYGEVEYDYLILPIKKGGFSIDFEPLIYFDTKKKSFEKIEFKKLEYQAFEKDENLSQNVMNQVLIKTNKVLDKVSVPKINEKSKNKNIYCLVILLLISVLLSVVFFILKRRFFYKIRKNKIEKPHQKIEQNFDLESYFDKMRFVLNSRCFDLFFQIFHEMNEKIVAFLSNQHKNETFNFLESIDYKKVEMYKDILSKMEIEEHAPVHNEDYLNELYYQIIKIYTELLK